MIKAQALDAQREAESHVQLVAVAILPARKAEHEVRLRKRDRGIRRHNPTHGTPYRRRYPARCRRYPTSRSAASAPARSTELKRINDIGFYAKCGENQRRLKPGKSWLSLCEMQRERCAHDASGSIWVRHGNNGEQTPTSLLDHDSHYFLLHR